MINQSVLSKWALAASVFAFCVIALGAYTRLIDAGLGCPDWPGCYGHISVPMTQAARDLANHQYPGLQLTNYKAWAEMIHRYAVSGLSLLILTIILLVLTNKPLRIKKNIIASFALIVLITYQIILGMWTVTLKLMPIIVSQHLLGGFLILSTLWLIYLMNKNSNSKSEIIKNHRGLLLACVVALVLVFLQISLGAWTSTNYTALSCPDFPFCHNENPFTTMQFKAAFNMVFPVGMNYEGGVLSDSVRQTIQMTHRIGALGLTLYMFFFMLFSRLKLKNFPDVSKSLYLVFGLLCVQLSLGIANVIFKLPLVTAMLHNLVAALLLLAVITLLLKFKAIIR